MKVSQARRDALVSLVPPGATLVVDVGADHGHVAQAVGAIAVERQPHRRGRAAVPWVIADGLAPFRHVPVAILAGIGARTIAKILGAAPKPDVAILHAPDDPTWLRPWLAEHGWRIDGELLATEGARFAEILRVVPGVEPTAGLTLRHGPHLLAGDHPLRAAWLASKLEALRRLRADLGEADPARAAQVEDELAFLAAAQRSSRPSARR